MSINKGNKAHHVKLSNNQVAETTNSQQNRIIYYNKPTKKEKWENSQKNIQKDIKPGRDAQDGQSSSNSKKRKSCDDVDSILSRPTLKIESIEDKSYGTVISETNVGQNKIKAHKRSRKNKKNASSDTNVKCTLNDPDSNKSTKNQCNVTLVDKINPKSIRHGSKESVKVMSIPPETIKANSHPRIGPKHTISAQSRLISKRKEFEITAKRVISSLAANNEQNLLMELEKQETVKTVHNVERKITCGNGSVRSATPVINTVRKRVKQHLKEFKEKIGDINDDSSVNDDSSMSLDEEMDWEPSEQEVMIEHIKKMRRDCSNVEELSTDIAVCSNTYMDTTQDNSDLILVFDTNVFISCLPFLKEIRDTHVPAFGLPRLFIPWRVLQELDHLKTSSIKPLQVSAIRAIRFLNENFSSRHPRVGGQSFEDRAATEKGSSCADDEILHVCLHLKQKDQSKIVILITNDRNLESKAIVSGIEAFSKDRFVKEKLRDSNQKVSSISNGTKTKYNSLKNDMAYCRLKGALKKFFEQLLETELRNAFSKDWKKIVAKKPPWTLMDMFECLIKHWRSVFHFIFKGDVLVLLEDLNDNFKKVYDEKITAITDIANVSKELLTRIKVCVGDEKPYLKILREALTEVEMWTESKNPSDVENHTEAQAILPQSPVASSSEEPSTTFSPQFDIALCREKVKSLFQIIWDQVKAFYFRVSELAAANGMNNPDAVFEVKTQFPHVIRNVQELVEIVEKLLSLGPEDGYQANQIILHFTNFLVGLNVFQIDATELNNLPGYIGLFCGDADGRIVLCSLVNDLKQFAIGMMDGMKVLERLTCDNSVNTL